MEPLAAEPPGSAMDGRSSRLLHFTEAYAMVGLLIAVFVFFSVWPKTSAIFFTTANLQTLWRTKPSSRPSRLAR